MMHGLAAVCSVCILAVVAPRIVQSASGVCDVCLIEGLGGLATLVAAATSTGPCEEGTLDTGAGTAQAISSVVLFVQRIPFLGFT